MIHRVGFDRGQARLLVQLFLEPEHDARVHVSLKLGHTSNIMCINALDKGFLGAYITGRT